MNSVKLQDTKINKQNSVSFLYTNNKIPEKGIKKANQVVSKTIYIKYLGKNLTKDIKDLNTENSKTLTKEIEDKNEWK